MGRTTYNLLRTWYSVPREIRSTKYEVQGTQGVVSFYHEEGLYA